MRRSARILTVPNLLTLARLASLPVIIMMLRSGHAFAAACIFACAMITDCFDGWLAVRLDQCTRLGLYLDPVVDKIVILSLFYELAAAGIVSPVVAHLFLARELLQNAIRAVAASGGTVVGANWMGKTKAVLQTLVITWGLAMPALANAAPVAGVELNLMFRVSAWAVLCLAWCFFGVFASRNRSSLV